MRPGGLQCTPLNPEIPEAAPLPAPVLSTPIKWRGHWLAYHKWMATTLHGRNAATGKNAAGILAHARISRSRIPELPADVRPHDESEAYAIQDQLADALLHHHGGEIVGYKIACTNELAQRQLGVRGPFFGRLLSPFCMESPACLMTANFDMRVIEPEFAFRMARDLPPSDTPRTHDEIADAIEGVLPAIEIVDSRYESWTTIGVLSLISDNACNAAWVRGPLIRDWRTLDLAAQTVRLSVNGTLRQTGSGAAVLGHPLNAVQWLVEALHARGLSLKAGQFITTGVTTGVYEAAQGDRITADFGPVGSVDVTFE
jgi:2-keto-4-pentenoate hydratase